ncbi:hypothetical protein OIU77_023884 [Salix suchowensis]|uniref:ATP synthase F0 subunit 8 n=1 Tax=Salix suchowensis TaxID=1278906 RepID=A0ABQ9C5F3_9ROSI|nr:hypothetical protein OIU77_023884 [Salix suchowensis]
MQSSVSCKWRFWADFYVQVFFIFFGFWIVFLMAMKYCHCFVFDFTEFLPCISTLS